MLCPAAFCRHLSCRSRTRAHARARALARKCPKFTIFFRARAQARVLKEKKHLKKNFLTGLAILIPSIITFAIITFIFNVLTIPFQGFLSKLIALTLVGCLIFFIGFLGSHWLIDLFFSFIDAILIRIPIFSRIYGSSKELVSTFLAPDSNNFKQVVMVPFFHKKSYVMGFVAKDHRSDTENPERLDKISVFIPGTPNPTFGYMLYFKPDEVVFLDIKVDEAIKFILSFGTIYPANH